MVIVRSLYPVICTEIKSQCIGIGNIRFYPIIFHGIPKIWMLSPHPPHLCRFKRLLDTPNKGPTGRTTFYAPHVRWWRVDNSSTQRSARRHSDHRPAKLDPLELRTKRIEDSHMIDVVVSNSYSFTSDNHLKWGGFPKKHVLQF